MSVNKKITILKQLFSMLKADGIIDEKEKKFLIDIALSMNINSDDIRDAIDLQKIVPITSVKFSRKDNIIQIYRLALMLKIDGKIAPEEILHIKNIGLEMGLDSDSIDIMLKTLLKEYDAILSEEDLFKIFDIQNN